MRIPLSLSVVLLLVLTGCPPGDDRAADGPEVARSYADELDVDLRAMRTTPAGTRYRDVEVGEGEEAQPGREVVVHYTGWLPDGYEFDSSRGREPFSFLLGAGHVIRGWDDGVTGMREGGRRQLVIPPELGYGERGAGGVIPPHATLVFDVELLEVGAADP